MCKFVAFFLKLSTIIAISDGAKILAVFPAPFYSHQSVFRPLTQELARRGHEIVIITTDPAFKTPPTNIKEIDIHKASYEFKNKAHVTMTGRTDDIYEQVDQFYDMFTKLFEVQINTADVKNLINDKDQRFDLLLIEACVRPALVFSHIFKAPVITISSLGSLDIFTKYLKTSTHPLLYPTSLQQRLHNLTLWEKAQETYKYNLFEKMFQNKEAKENEMLLKIFGPDVPPLSELKRHVELLLINVHHVWEQNRPVPPNIIYLGGLHLATNDTEKLPAELKKYLDSSTQGVIYMSLGSTVKASILPLEYIQIILGAFSKLSYNVLMKWDEDYLPGCPDNVKIEKWVPQKKLLRHPNIKLFITQGGIQSTDEAIVAGVPVIGIPILGDQWYNVEMYVHLKIGLRIDFESLTEKTMLNAIKTVIEDKSYRNNIIKLRGLMYDQPQSSLDRAVWWTEHIVRHGKGTHLKSASAHKTMWEYLEMDLVLTIVTIAVMLLFLAGYGALGLYRINTKQML